MIHSHYAIYSDIVFLSETERGRGREREREKEKHCNIYNNINLSTTTLLPLIFYLIAFNLFYLNLIYFSLVTNCFQVMLSRSKPLRALRCTDLGHYMILL